jgi:F420-0:gamma-glutamyl ligase-like protein
MQKIKDVLIDGIVYQRIPVKTHLITFGENLKTIINHYVIPRALPEDWLAISEKVVSVCQNNARHISEVKTGWLAKLIVKGVKKYPNDIGYSRPEKMQVAIDLAGKKRIIPAMLIGGLGKIIGIRGLFWKIANHRISEIDGFNPDAMYPYTEYAILPPQNPEVVCREIEQELNIPNTIIDGNNINVEIIAMSPKMPINKKIARKVLLDNPMGQDRELTPFILVRKR